MRLQTAVDALGDDNSPEAKMLRDALKKAQQEATMAPVGVRLDACAQFVERARNGLSRADEVLRKAQDERVRLEQELRDGEQRLEALRVEASEQWTPPAGGPGDEISQMQKLVTDLNQICSGVRCILPGVATEPCTQGQVVERRWSTKLEQHPSIARRSPGNRRVDECEKLRSAGCGSRMCAVMQQTPSGGVSTREGIEFSIDIEDTLSKV